MKNYDPSCYELAQHFLTDVSDLTPAQQDEQHDRLQSLAQAIQDAIEAWFQDEEFAAMSEKDDA